MYAQTPNGDVVPDFSGVGYRNGEAAIPTVAAVETLSPVAGDNADEIQAAIDRIAQRPLVNGFRGAVMLNAGTYTVGSTIFIRASGIVVRGAGPQSGGTRINYTDVTGNKDDDQLDCFRFEGGGITYNESSRRRIQGSYVPYGRKYVTLPSGHGYQAGEWVVIHHKPNQAWIDLIDMGQYGWTPAKSEWRAEREVLRVEGNTIYLDAPIMDSVQSEYGTADLVKISTSSRIENVGIENLRIAAPSNLPETDTQHGWKAVAFQGVKHGWARNVDAYHFGYSCASIEDDISIFITVDNCRYLDPIWQYLTGTRYSFNNNGQRVLVQNCVSSGPEPVTEHGGGGRHCFVSGSFTPGPSVFYNCQTTNARSDSGQHHRWTTGHLYDRITTDRDIRVRNRGSSGSGHGWVGAQIMMWNCVTESLVVQNPPGRNDNWAIGCTGDVSGGDDGFPAGIIQSEGAPITAIPSLFLAQLSDRLNVVAAPTFTPAAGTYTSAQSVAIVPPTPEATIRYTTDGSTPTTTHGTIYTGPITIGTSTTLKAIAYVGASPASPVRTGTYTINAAQAGMPNVSPAGGTYATAQSVTLTPSTSGTTIRYTTNGTTPTSTTGTVYSGPITVSSTTTLKAVAYGNGFTTSPVRTVDYVIDDGSTLVPATPDFANFALPSTETGAFVAEFDAVPSGTDATLALCSGSQAAYTGLAVIVRFNATGTIDARNGGAYAAASTIPYSTGVKYRFRLVVDLSTHTYSAYVTPAGGSEQTIGLNHAFRTEQNQVAQLSTLNIDTNGGPLRFSPVTIDRIPDLDAPGFDLPGGIYTSARAIEIRTEPGATIRYTTNGTNPSTTAGTIYSGPINIGSTTTVKAVAYGPGYLPSPVATATYTITQGGAPVTQYTFAGPRTFTGAPTDYVEAAASNGAGPNLTVAFFATPAQLANMSVIDKLPATGSSGWSIKLRSNGDLWFRVGSEASRTDVTTTAAYALNTRVHLACTFGSGTARIYVNGVEVRSAPVTTHSVANASTPLRLGVPSAAALSNTYAGTLEIVRIYNTALTAGQIHTLATNPTWTFDNAQVFNGTTDFVDGDIAPGSAPALTVSFFSTAAKLANMQPVDKLPSSGNGGWSVKLRSNGDLWFRIGSEATRQDLVVAGAYAANTRVHIACTFASGTASVYVNGVFRGSTPIGGYTTANLGIPLRLAIPSESAATNIYHGTLEKVRIYHRALSAGEIARLYSTP